MFFSPYDYDSGLAFGRSADRLTVAAIAFYLVLLLAGIGVAYLAGATEPAVTPPNGGWLWPSLNAWMGHSAALSRLASVTALIFPLAIAFCLDKRDNTGGRPHMKDNTRALAGGGKDDAAALFLSTLFDGIEPSSTGSKPHLTAVDHDIINRMNKRLDEVTPADIDVRAHLAESQFTARLPVDLTTATALKALGEALEWAWYDYQRENGDIDRLGTDGGDGGVAV